MDKMNLAAGSGDNAVRPEPADAGGHLAERRADAMPYAVFLYIWGTEWLLSSIILFFDPGAEFAAWRQAALVAALIVTAAVLLWRSRNKDKPVRSDAAVSLGAALPVLAAALVIAALLQTGVVDAMYMPLLKGIVLAAAYGGLSLRLGRPLLYISLWMLALTLTVAFAYLGYASVLLGGFGGLSMVVLGILIRMWHMLWKRRLR